MAKKGFTIDNIPPFLAQSADKAGWTLCIGAGTSVPIFPDWYSLSEQLAQQIVPDQPLDISAMKASGFSPDALIQMVKNSSELNDHDFAMRMSETLYANFKSQIDPNDWKAIAQILQSDMFSHAPLRKWKTFIKYRDSVLQNTTAYKLAPIILKAVEKDVAPKSILTFNAEPIFFTILNSFLLETRTDAVHTVPKKLFCKIINSVSNQGSKQIPYIFCHGLLPITKKVHKFSTSIDKLVFLEEEYLQLANNAFSWQSTTFLNICTTQHIVFIGTSLTDPNMRRWLSWVHTNRVSEMKQNGIDVKDSTQHYWIRTIPKDKSTIPWIESIVSHLGVRIIWIENWDQSALALEKILGLTSTSSNTTIVTPSISKSSSPKKKEKSKKTSKPRQRRK